MSMGLHQRGRHQLHHSQLTPRARGLVLLLDVSRVRAIDRVPTMDFFAELVAVNAHQTDRWHTVAQRLEERLRPRRVDVVPLAVAHSIDRNRRTILIEATRPNDASKHFKMWQTTRLKKIKMCQTTRLKIF